MDAYSHIVDQAVAYGKALDGPMEKKVEATLDKMNVLFGKEILKIVPGRVSTEVDARLSFRYVYFLVKNVTIFTKKITKKLNR